jgi:hypothetical protein
MRAFVRVMAAAVALLPFHARAQAPPATSLVVVVTGEARYHEPSCPLVAKAGSNVTMMKLSEATTKGLAPHDCEGAAIEQPKKDANAVPVFVQSGDKRYHKARCVRLGDSATSVALGEAGRKYWPCPACKPPIRQKEKGLD